MNWTEDDYMSPEQEREQEARAECNRRGLDPDDDAADGVQVWMVVDQELRQRPLRQNSSGATLIFCVPNDKHEGPCDMSGWVDIVEPTTGRVTGGSAVCKKCGMMALNNSIWD